MGGASGTGSPETRWRCRLAPHQHILPRGARRVVEWLQIDFLCKYYFQSDVFFGNEHRPSVYVRAVQSGQVGAGWTAQQRAPGVSPPSPGVRRTFHHPGNVRVLEVKIYYFFLTYGKKSRMGECVCLVTRLNRRGTSCRACGPGGLPGHRIKLWRSSPSGQSMKRLAHHAFR